MTKHSLLVLLVALWACVTQAAPQGRYEGVGPAKGMRLELSAGRGVLTSETGVTHGFDAVALAEGVEGSFPVGGGGRLYLFAQPRGEQFLDVVIAPLTEAGALNAAAVEFLPFARPGARLGGGERLIAPPGPGARSVDPRGFAASYRYWPAAEVARAYGLLPARFRSVFKLFPTVQAELIWRMCQSGARGAAVGEALAGQGLSCKSALAGAQRAQSSGKFGQFRSAADKERATLMVVLDCADDLTRTQRDCAAAARETSRRAVSMETAATALARYR